MKVDQTKFYGKFYSAVTPQASIVGCRSVLEICRQSRSLAELEEHLPELSVIMMNPGGSYPFGFDKQEWFKNRIFAKGQFLEAVPDETQRQIVRVMEKLGPEFTHARIFNLTNYCQAKSKDLWFYGGQFLEDESVFKGRQKLILPKESKILFAWGVDRCLQPLKDLVGLRGVGVLKTGTIDCYRHPLPRNRRDQDKWVRLAVRAVRANQNVCWNTGKVLDD